MSTAFQASARARGVAVLSIFKDLRSGNVNVLPQRVAVVGQGTTAATYSLSKLTATSSKQVGDTYGYGSPLHLSAKELFPSNNDGVGTIPVTFYPMNDDGSGVIAAGSITPSGTATLASSVVVIASGISSLPFLIAASDTVATIIDNMVIAINGQVDMPIIAADGTTVCNITSKWLGASANDITLNVVSTVPDVTYALVQPTGGSTNPDVDAPLALMGEDWETMVVNCLEIADTTTLGKYTVFGDGRWGATTKKPLVVFTGNTIADQAAAVVVADARPTDKINSQAVAPGSVTLPFLVAARKVARMAVRADSDPAFDYGSLDLDTIEIGTAAEQWDYTQRDAALKAGSSTVVVKDGVLNIADTVTFYKPVGETEPAYRYVVDIVKLQTILYNLELIFNSPEWDGAPLIPDDQMTTNPNAKSPKMAKAAVAELAGVLGDRAIISNPEFTKQNIIATIDSGNAKRLNITMPVTLAGNTNMISVDLNFGFHFGQS